MTRILCILSQKCLHLDIVKQLVFGQTEHFECLLACHKASFDSKALVGHDFTAFVGVLRLYLRPALLFEVPLNAQKAFFRRKHARPGLDGNVFSLVCLGLETHHTIGCVLGGCIEAIILIRNFACLRLVYLLFPVALTDAVFGLDSGCVLGRLGLGHAYIALKVQSSWRWLSRVHDMVVELYWNLGLNLIYIGLLTTEHSKLFLFGRWLLVRRVLKCARVVDRHWPHLVAVDAVFVALLGEVLRHLAHFLAHLDFRHRLVDSHVLDILKRISRPF